VKSSHEDFPAGARLFRSLALRLKPGFVTIEHMTIQRMEHVGIYRRQRFMSSALRAFIDALKKSTAAG
jgi:hypothetical protein